MAERHGLSAGQALIERDKLARLNDRLYVLEAACEDVRPDLEAAHDLDAYRDAVVHLLEAALPLRTAYIEPKAIGESTGSSPARQRRRAPIRRTAGDLRRSGR